MFNRLIASTYNQTALVVSKEIVEDIRINYRSVQTFNLAYGGATIDSGLVPPYIPTVL